MISIDTTRADAIGIYGNKQIRTPNMDQLAGSGVLFKNMMSHVPLTLPSHATMLTGKLPGKIGIHDNAGYRLAPNETTLASVFQENGYRTAAFVGSVVLDHRFGLDRGFDVYNDYIQFGSFESANIQNERPAERTAEEALRWLSENSPHPFFLFVHFYDPHTKYAPPARFDSYSNRYYGEIAYVDEQIGRLLNALQSIRDKTLVVVTADHGEALGDHDELTHGLFLYDSTLHVPLIVSGPGLPQGKQIKDQTRLVDIMPTILEQSGIQVPSGMDGRSLLPLVQGREWSSGESISESYYGLTIGWSPLFSIRTQKWKYIDAPRSELYDLERDPRETKNLVEVETATVHQFSEKVKKYKESSTLPKQAEIKDPELEEQLRSLGYLSGNRKPRKEDYGSLPDPKDKIAVWKLYEQSMEAQMEGEKPKAATLLRQAIQLDPQNGVLHDSLAQILYWTDPEAAIQAWQKALQLEPDNARYHHKISICYKKMGQYDKSIQEDQIALKLEPDFQESLVGLGSTFLDLGKPEEALAYFQKSLELDPKNAAAATHTGTAYRMLNDINRAAEYYQKAISFNPSLPYPYNGLGVIKAQIGDLPQSIFYLKRATELDPQFSEAYYNLALAYQRAGQNSEALQAFQLFVQQADPTVHATRIEKAREWIQKLG